MSRKKRILNPLARDALDSLKYEVANELGLIDKINKQGWGDMTTREVGKLGGTMVKKMVKMAEDKIANNSDR
ncbi:alpha/beta-type small acid-soluble spore protein [Iocasia frigidifontis]|uniref:alpha/beta-type small acid-soluble spore protein n=1 Tax=Iocasia fonsfrigidae TaxID=2682810 RepID=UPI001E629602|nr:alpha/beta-type small acid-soluble spore protein [Iocasia fonsfrigidae]